MSGANAGGSEVPRFDRNAFRSPDGISRIGEGALGGKARGLIDLRAMLAEELAEFRSPVLEIHVPRMVVIATDGFDAFLRQENIRALNVEELSDDRIAGRFVDAALPVSMVGDLRSLIEQADRPLAVRSSSLLEDALLRPFAGVYETKMVPNNQPDADTRFTRLAEAIKLVYASTFFSPARDYLQAAGCARAGEKMAVIVQEIVGSRHDERFYPDVSGVARSYNFFPTGGAAPRDGVVHLALGLGKTIVDGGRSWVFSPARPLAPPPFGSVRDRMQETQLDFWAVNMGRPSEYNPVEAAEYLVKADLSRADYDDTLRRIASTYDAQRDRLIPGTAAPGPRVVDFAPLLADPDLRFGELMARLLQAGERRVGKPIELEFAMTLSGREVTTARLALLQLRPMLVSDLEIEITDEDLAARRPLVASERAVGNGRLETIRDIVYVMPERFEASRTPLVAAEVEQINRLLVDEGRRYLLIGFGRWGSSDPWLGIPVQWGQIAGAGAIIESTLGSMDVEASQGAHFFHNLIAFQVPYLCVRHDRPAASGGIDWGWLAGHPARTEMDHVRHLRLDRPLLIEVDGRTGRGAVWAE